MTSSIIKGIYPVGFCCGGGELPKLSRTPMRYEDEEGTIDTSVFNLRLALHNHRWRKGDFYAIVHEDPGEWYEQWWHPPEELDLATAQEIAGPIRTCLLGDNVPLALRPRHWPKASYDVASSAPSGAIIMELPELYLTQE